MNYILLGVLLILIAILLVRMNAQRNKKPTCPEKQWWIFD